MGILLLKGNTSFKWQVNLRCGPSAVQRQQHEVPLFLGGGRHGSFIRIALMKYLKLDFFPSEATGTLHGIIQGTSHTLLHHKPILKHTSLPTSHPSYTKHKTQMFLSSLGCSSKMTPNSTLRVTELQLKPQQNLPWASRAEHVPCMIPGTGWCPTAPPLESFPWRQAFLGLGDYFKAFQTQTSSFDWQIHDN